VKAKPGDSTDQMIRKFKKKVLYSQLLTQLKDKQYHKKPSVLKKEKQSEFKRRQKRRKKLKKQRDRIS